MADAKITALAENTTPALTDLLAIVDDPAGTPATKKITCANLLTLAYPIGSIFISTSSTNPGTSLGFGTWSAFGAGKVLVSLDSGDTDFDVAEETGGAKTVTLTAAQSGLPQHTHTQDAHSHVENAPSSASSGAMKFGIDTNASGTQDAGISTATTVAVNQNAGPSAAAEAHTNLMPYIVVYMFKRTA